MKGLMAHSVLPVVLEFPADLLTPVSAYLRLTAGAKDTKAFLFESVEGGERAARYSFIGVDPFESLRIRDGRLEIVSWPRGSTKIIEGNPWDSLGRELARYRSAPVAGLPPFSGGAVGYLGYESVGFLENIPRAPTGSAPYDAHFMFFRDVVAFDHVRHRVLLIHNLLPGAGNATNAHRGAQRRLNELRARLEKPARAERELSWKASAEPKLTAILGEKNFTAAVKQIKEAIRRGDIFQCVLSDEFRFQLRTDPFRIYRALRGLSPAPYLFHLNFGDETLLGASPEMLTRVSEGGLVETCPIAGTRPRGSNELEDKKFERQLLESVKERAEHLMLVDLGRNDLGRVSKSGSVRVSEFMQVQRFSHVMHLVSLVEGRLAARHSAWDALGSCFPAGTLTGAPKIRAMEIISRLEPIARGPYGGAVVYADFSGRLDSCITIRSLYARDGVGVIRAGAGVVADSQAAREYEEIRNKTKSIRRAVALAGKGPRGRK